MGEARRRGTREQRIKQSLSAKMKGNTSHLSNIRYLEGLGLSESDIPDHLRDKDDLNAFCDDVRELKKTHPLLSIRVNPKNKQEVILSPNEIEIDFD